MKGKKRKIFLKKPSPKKGANLKKKKKKVEKSHVDFLFVVFPSSL